MNFHDQCCIISKLILPQFFNFSFHRSGYENVLSRFLMPMLLGRQSGQKFLDLFVWELDGK